LVDLVGGLRNIAGSEGSIVAMDKPRGFTLIELLVVIAVIGLLVAILVPVLGKARRHVKAVACMSNLRHWAQTFGMYTGDYDGHFIAEPAYNPDGSLVPGERGEEKIWYTVLWQYHRERKLYYCPLATKAEDEGGRNPFSAWHHEADELPDGWGFEYPSGEKHLYGSYGMNYWIRNWRPGYEDPASIQWLTYYWRRADVKKANEIPLILDCQWSGVEPVADAFPPEYDGEVVAELDYCEDDMKRVCLNRQRNGMTNGAFMDFSVRRIGLKELWKLRWHRHWSAERSQVGTPEWPAWMRNFRDY
jgi:prepilin-type N-terminal cleavage/methylation domain-containing protein